MAWLNTKFELGIRFSLQTRCDDKSERSIPASEVAHAAAVTFATVPLCPSQSGHVIDLKTLVPSVSCSRVATGCLYKAPIKS